MISAVVVFVLFVSELSNFLSTTPVEHMKVDPSLGERLTINLDITFHALRCGGMQELPPPVCYRGVLASLVAWSLG